MKNRPAPPKPTTRPPPQEPDRIAQRRAVESLRSQSDAQREKAVRISPIVPSKSICSILDAEWRNRHARSQRRCSER